MSTTATQDAFLCQVAEEAAERGFSLLEERWPGFYLAIDTAKLSLESEQKCVLGQLSSWTPIPKWALDYPSLQDALNDLYEDGDIGRPNSEFASFEAAQCDFSKEVCVANWDVARNFLGLTLCQAAHYGFLDVVSVDNPCPCDDPDDGYYVRRSRSHIAVGYIRVERAWFELIEQAQNSAMRRELVTA